MLRAALLSLVASVLVSAFHVEVPPAQSGHSVQDNHPRVCGGDDPAGWSLEALPNPNATDHLVFETVHSLLQRGPNARMRNGHSVVPGIIPKGTLLYHGTHSDQVPLVPEWVAIDPELSYFFCSFSFQRDLPPRACWHLTLATTRPLKIVYFDGTSAAKWAHGTLDTQDLIAWGGPRPDSEWDEGQRIQDLCQWGSRFGVDGFVRMAVNFEVMLCDFTSGVRVVSFTSLRHPPDVPQPSSGILAFQVLVAGSWHNRFPGETRVQLDLTGLVSFYDTQLVPSLVPVRAGQERWDHRTRNTSQEDAAAVKAALEAALVRPAGLSSGTDWRTLIQVIVDRFADRLELVRHLLRAPTTSAEDLFDRANKTQTQLRVILTPYLLLSAVPTDPSDDANVGWTGPIYKGCATIHTEPLVSDVDSMTDSERLLFRAVRGTTREICRVVTKMWAAGVYAGVDGSLNTKASLDAAEVARVWRAWTEDLDRLMGWLDWSVWAKCDPACEPEEICYIPTWPHGFPGFPPHRPRLPDLAGSSSFYGPQERLSDADSIGLVGIRPIEGAADGVEPGPDDWVRPRPKCIRRVDTFEF